MASNLPLHDLNNYPGISDLFRPSSAPPKTSSPPPQKDSSYASAVKSSLGSNSAVPKPPITTRGGFKLVQIPQDVYAERVRLCEHSLIGRVILNKGDKPWTLADLKLTLTKIWGIKSEWRLISLGRGFFHVMLGSQALKDSVWSRGALTLKPGIFRLQPWVPDFDPFAQKSSTAQVWVRFHSLPWEYWDPRILANIARCVGVPLRIDNVTLNGDFGHYARILIDIDFSSDLPTTVGIERDGREFWIDVVYENLPSFCKVCCSIGHLPYECRHAKKPVHKQPDPDTSSPPRRGRSRTRAEWSIKDTTAAADRTSERSTRDTPKGSPTPVHIIPNPVPERPNIQVAGDSNATLPASLVVDLDMPIAPPAAPKLVSTVLAANREVTNVPSVVTGTDSSSDSDRHSTEEEPSDVPSSAVPSLIDVRRPKISWADQSETSEGNWHSVARNKRLQRSRSERTRQPPKKLQ